MPVLGQVQLQASLCPELLRTTVCVSPHTEQRLLPMFPSWSEKPELYGKHCLVQGSFLHRGFFTIMLPEQGSPQELALSLYLLWDFLHSTRQCKKATTQIYGKLLTFACVPKVWYSLCSFKANRASKMNKIEARVIASYLTLFLSYETLFCRSCTWKVHAVGKGWKEAENRVDENWIKILGGLTSGKGI